jgi:flagellar biosynthesis protein FlhA
MEERGFPPVVLCSPKARSHVKEATRRKLPNLAVLSYVEIPQDISVEPVGEIRFEGSVRFPENMI